MMVKMFLILSKSNFSTYLKTLYQHSRDMKTPFFTVKSHQIEILNDPLDFYLQIIKGIDNANYRIAFSSLYLGTGSLQRYLLKRIRERMLRNHELKVSMMFDFNRSNREENGESPITMISNWLEDIVLTNITVGYYKPGSINGLLGEIAAVHHQKLLLFDNKLIIGGANLSKNYFLNRKDRYMLIKHSPQLCDYFYDLINFMAYDLKHPPQNKRSTTNGKPPLQNHYKLWKLSYEPNKYESSIEQQQVYLHKQWQQKQKEYRRNINGKQSSKPVQDIRVSVNRNQQILQTMSTYIQAAQDQIQPSNIEQIKQYTRQRLFTVESENHIGNQLIGIKNIRDEQSDFIGQKVYIFPFCQMPPFSENSESQAFDLMIKSAVNSQHKVRLSSGYMNFPTQTIQLLAQCAGQVNILCSSPQANSFYQGGIFKKNIPYYYRCFQEAILSQYPQKFVIKEFNNQKWSFHSKGVWIEENINNYLTIIGSSNYNRRSREKDTEFQLYLFSQCAEFNQRLNKEWLDLSLHCHQISVEQIRTDKQVSCTWSQKQLSRIFSRFL